MRLIDADNIQDELANLILFAAGTPEGDYIDYAHNLIDEEPSVDAIPISFIKNYIDGNNLDDEENDPWSFYMYALLTNWLNEPERDKWYEIN